MKKEEYELNIAVILKSVLKRFWIVVLVALLCGAIMFLYVDNFVAPKYKSTLKLYVNNRSNNGSGYVTSGEINAAKDLVNTYIAILETPDTIFEVKKRANLNYSYSTILKMIDTGAVDETEIFSISVSAPTAKEAKLIADTVAEVLPERISKIVEDSSVQIVQQATMPSSNYYPDKPKYTLLGTFVGAFFSALLLVVLELIDNTIKDNEYASDVYGAKTLASIPKNESSGSSHYTSSKNGKKKRLFNLKKRKIAASRGEIVLCDKMSFHVSEAYKMLRTGLFNVLENVNNAVIGITSANPKDGKSTIAINLSYVLAQSNKKVLLIDADLRKPVVAKRLKLKSSNGLAEILSEGAEADIKDSGYYDNWKVISAGHTIENPSELLGSKKMKQLLAELRNEYDYIVIDLPPINEVTDSIAISPYLDGLMLAVKQDITTRFELELAMKHLEFSKTELLGFVYTNVSYESGYGKYSRYGRYKRYGRYSAYGKYGYSYGYGYGYGHKPAQPHESTEDANLQQ